MSKGYTLSYFINLVSKSPVAKTTGYDVYRVVSPRLGDASVKSFALDLWLSGQTNNIVKGSGKFSKYGKTPRARVLKALNNRKKLGMV